MTVAAFVLLIVLLIVLFIMVLAWAMDDDGKGKRSRKLPEQSEKYGKCPEPCPYLLKGGVNGNGFIQPCFCARYDTVMWTVTTHVVARPGTQPEQECYAPRECDIAREANLNRPQTVT